ncbi:MAG: response regulator [Deltaproteobacteria bacterium]|nr:response regulator [Deltaproteobacteria bacterium]
MSAVAFTKGEEVVTALKSALADGNPFDCCILDIQMPGMSGYDVAKQIRNFKAPIKSIPLLALSSLMERDAGKCEEAGFNGFLNKPIRREKLYKMLERLLGMGNLDCGLQNGKDRKDQRPKPKTRDSIMTQYSVREGMKHSVSILLAEDNPVNQKLAKMMLTKAGYQVEVVNNGHEAVERYTTSPGYFDLILMDVQMPEMDGLEATETIRKIETRNLSRQNRDRAWNEEEAGKIETGDPPHQSSIVNRQSSTQRIPIIAMTANAMIGDREACLDAGMDDYMSKPIKREIVFEVLEKWVFRG